jgi:hypothetical protein
VVKNGKMLFGMNEVEISFGDIFETFIKKASTSYESDEKNAALLPLNCGQ